jgi:hypothetical protein
MSRALGRVIPPGTQERFRRITVGSSQAPKLALELVLNDASLEQYPWELIGAQEVFTSSFSGAGVWRHVSPTQHRERIKTPTVLLAGSSPFDLANPFTHQELEHLAHLLDRHYGIISRVYPAVAFSRIIELLDLEYPSILHLVAHGSDSEFMFQDRSKAPAHHRGVSYKELSGFLQQSRSCALVYLSVCDSASAGESGNSPARYIAVNSDVAAIGMAGEISPEASLEFAELFYDAIVSGSTSVDAFTGAVAQLLRPETLIPWSTPIMYSTNADAAPYSGNDLTRAHLTVEEIGFQLRAISREIRAINDLDHINADLLNAELVNPAFRVATLRDMIETLGRQSPSWTLGVLERLQVERTRSDIGVLLERTETSLDRLAQDTAELADLDTFDSILEELVATLDTVRKLGMILKGR